MKKKIIVIIFVCLLSVSCAFAKDRTKDRNIVVSYTFSPVSCANTLTCDWVFKCFDLGTAGTFKFFAGGGYSLANYTGNGSNALVYGPALEAGCKLEFPVNQRIKIGFDSGIFGSYAQFPNVFQYRADISAAWSFEANGKPMFLELSAGFSAYKEFRDYPVSIGLSTKI